MTGLTLHTVVAHVDVMAPDQQGANEVLAAVLNRVAPGLSTPGGETMPTGSYSVHAPPLHPVVVLVLRDPDASNYFEAWNTDGQQIDLDAPDAPVATLDIDLGAYSLDNLPEFTTWVAGMADEIAALPEGHPARASAAAIVVGVADEHGHPYPEQMGQFQ